MDHHPVFGHFQPESPVIPDDCVQDSFLGTVRRDYVLNIDGYSDQGSNFLDYPQFDEEYFEWIDLLEGAMSARGSYTFMELGAGFGRWSIRAAAAARGRGLDIKVIAAEPEHMHFLWMKDNFSLNGVNPCAHELIEAAVNDIGGQVTFTVAGDAEQSKPDKWYGQTTVNPWKVTTRKILGVVYPRLAPTWTVVKVQAIPLATILDGCGRVDVADLDLQGAELKVLEAGIGRVNDRIRRLHIGTHSTAIEAGLRRLMAANAWECLADWPGRRTNETPFGAIQFGDGVQTWLNPRLA